MQERKQGNQKKKHEPKEGKKTDTMSQKKERQEKDKYCSGLQMRTIDKNCQVDDDD